MISMNVEKQIGSNAKLPHTNRCAMRQISIFFEKMAGVTGLEPAASGVTGRRSNQLSYTP